MIDTIVLARLIEGNPDASRAAERTLKASLRGPQFGLVCAQVIQEFWVVATRPVTANGLGLEPVAANECVSEFLRTFLFLPHPPELFSKWRELVMRTETRGKTAHDTKLVALMELVGVERVMTFNSRDFRRFPNVEVVVPP
ncbi:MAG: type II toxin-antitoxin system VapC family toxin [Phycisphaerae bacterium]